MKKISKNINNKIDIINDSSKKYNPDVTYIVEISAIDIIEKEFGKLKNIDVVLTNERKKHIEIRRKSDADYVINNICTTIKDYDILLKSREKENTIIFIKNINGYNNYIVVKLSLTNAFYANSVITGIKTNDKKLKKAIAKNKIIDMIPKR